MTPTNCAKGQVARVHTYFTTIATRLHFDSRVQMSAGPGLIITNAAISQALELLNARTRTMSSSPRIGIGDTRILAFCNTRR